MRLKTKKSEDEIRKTFFDPNLKKASSQRGFGVANPNASMEWTELSEMRLLQKTIQFKPAGVNRHFHLGLLTNHMNNIYEYEDDTDFELFLTNEDFQLYQKRRDIPNKTDILVFKPLYKIRPTPEMIMKKLETMYNMEEVEKNEYVPDHFLVSKDFSLPPQVTGFAEPKIEDRVTPATSHRKKTSQSRSATPVSKLSKR